jgi:hypothetical protein
MRKGLDALLKREQPTPHCARIDWNTKDFLGGSIETRFAHTREKTGPLSAGERIRTSTPFGNMALNHARLPIPPRPL